MKMLTILLYVCNKALIETGGKGVGHTLQRDEKARDQTKTGWTNEVQDGGRIEFQ